MVYACDMLGFFLFKITNKVAEHKTWKKQVWYITLHCTREKFCITSFHLEMGLKRYKNKAEMKERKKTISKKCTVDVG